jgi:2-polyprenyl-3-methyl-5-hydroxy-6-metoxy-1,4-benzoquinol methylase
MDDRARAQNAEGRQIWDAKAEFWDQLHGDSGNRFHRTYIGPAVENLLELEPGERVLDIACGNGTVARQLAALGAQVTAVDFSAQLIERAQSHPQRSGPPITYMVADATDESALRQLGEGHFDAVVCTMALMDMPVIAPLYRAARHLVTAQGRLVIATSHPAFNSCNPIFFAELADEDGTLIQRTGIKIRAYLDIPATKGTGAVGEPAPHYYFHRPLHELLGEAFTAGWVLDALLEPTLDAADSETSRLLGWSGVPQIPPVLVARLRPNPL